MRSGSDVPKQARLQLVDVTKSFNGLAALDGVNLALHPGCVHALLGANGSGKSTLVKVLTGAHEPDSGQVVFDGKVTRLSPPAVAAGRGVRVIHQEAPLVDQLTVLENVALVRGYGSTGLAPVPWRALRERVRKLLDAMDVPVGLDQRCGTVGPADRAGLALAIAVGDSGTGPGGGGGPEVSVLVVDEVTAAIPDAETGRHLDRLRRVADSGVAVVMVTHRLAELRIADEVTVLRDGKVVHRESGGTRSEVAELISVMVGAPVPMESSSAPGPREAASRHPVTDIWASTGSGEDAPARRPSDPAVPAIVLSGLAGGSLHGLDLTAMSGEVVGFSGLRGSGIEDLPRLLSGALRSTAGSVTVGGRVVPMGVPAKLIGAGMTTVPADRLRDGGVATLSVTENIVLPRMRRYWHRPAERDGLVAAVVAAFDVRPSTPSARFGTLSGGNQQKVLLGKWLALRPQVLVLDDPTYGVDPGAREAIFEAVRDAASLGVCVLFFSTEPEQLVRACDRVVVLKEGRQSVQLDRPDLTLEDVMSWSAR